LINLFDNAIKYSQASSQVQVITHSQDRTVEIEIIDTGTGFATQDLPYVFDRLFRSDASRQQQQQSTSSSLTTGSGLGLAIVKQIILAHGGTVTAQNHPTTGQGCLKIKLPID
jgi:two-component system, OmpR family, phosphate regulon sensor histidine kinase PhoR